MTVGFAVVVLTICLGITFFARQIDAALPSWFADHLNARGWLYWRRWSPLSFYEAFYGQAVLWVVALLAYHYLDPVYHLFHGSLAARRTLLAVLAAGFVAVFVYAPGVGGYAIYRDHLMVQDPFRDVSARRVDIGDIDHVDIGCHERIYGRHSPNWRVPSYRLVLRDGRAVSLFDLADFNYDDPKLMSAVLAFDAQVRAHGVKKQMRKNVFGSDMSSQDCYAHMEDHFDGSLTPAIRQAFEGS